MIELRHVPVFKNLTSDELDRLLRVSVRFEPRDGSEIFVQGDSSDAVFAVLSGDGRVRIVATDRRSKALMAEFFRSGDIFGEIGVIDGGPRSATAISEGKIVLLRIDAAVFLRLLAGNASVGEALSRLLVHRLRRTFQMYQDATFETVEVRLARQILYLLEKDGRIDGKGVRIARRFRQGELADLLGTTTRSIIMILNNWRSAGIVTYDTTRAILTISDPSALRAISEDSSN